MRGRNQKATGIIAGRSRLGGGLEDRLSAVVGCSTSRGRLWRMAFVQVWPLDQGSE
jgi:hypothetical protein